MRPSILRLAAVLLAAPMALGAQVTGDAPYGKPAAIIDLGTSDGAALVQAQWRYSDAGFVEVDHHEPGPDLRASGAPNRTHDITPHAGPAAFDDGAWPVIPAESIAVRRGHGRFSFNWYRINVTVPARVGALDPTGMTIVFELVVDDYAEVWVNGALPVVLGDFDLTNAAPTDDDHSIQALAKISVEHDLAGQDRNMLFASATVYDGDQFKLDDFDTQSVGAQAGIRLEIGELFVTPSVTYTHLWLGEESYLDLFQAEARYDWRINDPVNLFAAFALGDYDYHLTDHYPNADDQSGLDVNGRMGVDWYIGSDHKLTFTYTHRRFDATTDFESFDGDRLNIDHVWLIHRGIFLVTNLSTEWDRYDALDPLFVGSDREDIIYRGRLTLGVPVATMFGAEQSGFLDGLLMSAYGEYYLQDSNRELNEFENIRAGLSISKRFEF